MGTVSSAHGDFVSLADSAFFEDDMEFFDFSSNVFILKGGPLVICQGVQVPIVLDTILNVSYKTLFHCFLHIWY